MLTPVGLQVRKDIPSLSLVVLLCSMLLLVALPASAIKSIHQIGAKVSSPSPGKEHIKWKASTAPTDAACRATFDVPCYSPQEIRQAYDITPVLKAGFTGKGETIVIIDSFGSPTALQDLQQFDKDYGLPDPPSFKVLSPLGSVTFDPTNDEEVGWAEETSLDVQWSHAIAPDASIVLLTSPVSETQGVQGMPQFLALEEYALDHHLGQIISQSWGTTENTLFTPAGKEVLHQFEAFYARAAAAHVTVFASSGDAGTANPDVNGNIYPFPTVGYPASSPWVTAVGGTSLYAKTNGNYQSETVWNSDIGASGGGISEYFKEPVYQQTTLPTSDQKLLDGYRGLPDISYNADPDTSVPVYLGFLDSQSGYYLFGGTSEGAPQWAGIIADADQYANRPLGFLNPLFYLIGANKHLAAADFHDTAVGNNAQDGITGYDATSGWDASTGWGTPIVASLFKALRLYYY